MATLATVMGWIVVACAAAMAAMILTPDGMPPLHTDTDTREGPKR